MTDIEALRLLGDGNWHTATHETLGYFAYLARHGFAFAEIADSDGKRVTIRYRITESGRNALGEEVPPS